MFGMHAVRVAALVSIRHRWFADITHAAPSGATGTTPSGSASTSKGSWPNRSVQVALVSDKALPSQVIVRQATVGLVPWVSPAGVSKTTVPPSTHSGLAGHAGGVWPFWVMVGRS